MTASATPLSLYQLRIVLCGISPLIWRRILVHSDTTLAHLHAILQILFAWSDEHLHRFHIHGREYGSSGAHPHCVLLSDLHLHRGERFRYVHDFCAHWACDIHLDAIRPLAPRRVYPVCIDGKRAVPFEDCREAWAYMERLDQHRLYPPLEAMRVVVDAISTLSEADPTDLGAGSAGGFLELREAVDCLAAYEQRQPERFDRREINAHLQSWVWHAGETR